MNLLSPTPDVGTAASMNRKILILLAALTAFGPLSIDMYLPAFPQITSDLGAGAVATVETTLAAFLLSMGICQILYGPLSDRFGRRRPLMIGCAIFIFGALGCASARSMEWLAGARLLQGLGGAAGVVIARAAVRDLLGEQQSARAFSQLMLVMGVAPILAPWMGGQLLAFGSWRGIFLLLSLFGLACLLAAAWIFPETLPMERRVNGGTGIVLHNFRRLLSDRSFLGYVLAAGFNSGTMFAYIAGSPLVFIKIYGVSVQHYGFLFGANALGLIAASQVNRLLLRRYSPEKILAAALSGNALTACGLAICGLTGWGGLPAMAALLFCCLSSIGLAYPNLAAAALARYGAFAGSASSLLGASQFLVGGVAGATVGLLKNGTAAPMTAVMATCGVGGITVLRLLTRKLMLERAELCKSLE